MLTFIHRSDNLLQNNVAKPIDESQMDTYIGKYTVPIHKALLKFLDEKLVGQSFENEEAIEDLVFTWPQFLRDNTEVREQHIFKSWGRIYISCKNKLCIATGGMGGDLWIGDVIPAEQQVAAGAQSF